LSCTSYCSSMFGYLRIISCYQSGRYYTTVLWIQIRKDLTFFFAGSGSVTRGCGFGFGSGSETGLDPYQKSSKNLWFYIKHTLNTHFL
jgi:hypothetical protein